MGFENDIKQFVKMEGQLQTHTFFNNNSVKTLHVPQDKHTNFYKIIYDYIKSTTKPEKGYSFTEKALDKFRFFVDVDFDIEHFLLDKKGKGKIEEIEPIDEDEDEELGSDSSGDSAYTAQLKLRKKYVSPSYIVKKMQFLITVIDSVITEIYGEAGVEGRLVACRLTYKIHMYYPNVVVNSDIACRIIEIIQKKIIFDKFLERIIHRNPKSKILDSSVYRTGLRLIEFGKASMDKNSAKKEEAHNRIYGADEKYRYDHCYHIINPDTFEKLPLTLDLFSRASIQIIDRDTVDITPYNSDLIDTHVKEKTHRHKQNNAPNGITVLQDDTVLSMNNIIKIAETIKYLTKEYNHVIMVDKIKYSKGFLYIPLDTKGCHFVNRIHQSNHQYIVLSRSGSKQRCHECSGQDWNPKSFSDFPPRVKKELVSIGINPKEVMVGGIDSSKAASLIKRGGGGMGGLGKNSISSIVEIAKKKALGMENLSQLMQQPSHEERVKKVIDIINENRHFYPRNELKIDHNAIIVNDSGAYVGLEDRWCEICGEHHDNPLTYFETLSQGQLVTRCRSFKCLGLYYPNPPITIAREDMQVIYNYNQMNNFLIINKYNTDVSEDTLDLQFTEEVIFPDDPELNHLLFESFNGFTRQMAEVVYHLGKKIFAYSVGAGWYKYWKHRWQSEAEGSIYLFVTGEIANVYRKVKNYYLYKEEDDDKLKNTQVLRLSELVAKCSNQKTAKDIISLAQHIFSENDPNFCKQLDIKNNLLGFNNGIYDLDTKEFRDGRPDDYITFSTGYDYLPFEEIDQELYQKVVDFIDSIQPEKSERDYLLKFISTFLHGSNKEEIFTMFSGNTRNGKSLLRDLIKATLGNYHADIQPNLLTKERPSSSSPQVDIVHLKGVRSVFGSEPETNQKINSGFMKYISGNDPMRARLLFSNKMIDYEPQFKFVILCNTRPAMDKDDPSVWSRSRIVDFPMTFVQNPDHNNPYERQQDNTLKSVIKSYKLAFMHLLLKYYSMYEEEGLVPTEKVKRFVEMYKVESSPTLRFILEETEYSGNMRLSSQTLFNAYKLWFKENYTGQNHLGSKNFYIELAKTGRFGRSEYVSGVCIDHDNPRFSGILYRRFRERVNETDEAEPMTV